MNVTQEPERLPARAIAAVALGVALVIAACVVIAWWIVAPTPAYATLPPTTLEHGAFDPQGDAQLGSAQLDTDRAVQAAIDEIVRDPSLIGGHR